MTAEALAPAKINLTLHVTGRREDGYHLLDSLVVFADIGDHLRVSLAPDTKLHITGPMSTGVPTDDSNLVVRAANLIGVQADIRLEKHLPNAAGIGGGSSDAGAVLRLLRDLSGKPVPGNGLSLGADLPVCMHAKAARMQGIGDCVTPLNGLPDLHAVLLNPMIAVPTGPVFKALHTPDNPPMPDNIPTGLRSVEFAQWLGQMRNDLEEPAVTVAPVIAKALSVLQSSGSLLSRMSGSGATCFGLYADAETAKTAAQYLGQTYPDWWICQTQLS